jgi:sugar phosphate isomerase/epimerase
MILFSTGGWKDKSALEATSYLKSLGINNIELSGGRPSEQFLNDLKPLKKDTCFAVHNYFPPPAVPFVFNLASNTPEVLENSLNHAKKAIVTACELGILAYSFHAGLLFDPLVDELGKKFGKYRMIEREEGTEIFLRSIVQLSSYAKKKNVNLLIENNVISKANFERFGSDPLLMTSPKESERILRICPDNVFTLLDVGHLYVSAQTLGFSCQDYIETVNHWIKAYHLSENNGLEDENGQITERSWFWKFLKPQHDVIYASLEIYKVESEQIKAQYEIANRMWS